MSNRQRVERNYILEWVKLILAVLLVFIHARLPGRAGDALDCFARITVPTFFAISGYYSFQIDDHQISRRLLHIFKIMLIASFVFCAWGIWKVEVINNGSTRDYLLGQFSIVNIAKFLIIGVNPFGGHLWYLTAIFYCYAFLWLYARFYKTERGVYDYRNIYLIGFILYLIHIAAGPVATAVGVDIHYTFYRNAWFFGIPMFSLGLFLREYQDALITKFSLTDGKLLLLILIGLFLSQIQWFGTGKVEMPLGTLIEVVSLILLVMPMKKKVSLKTRYLSLIAGKASTVVYITHNMYIYILEAYEDVLVIPGKSERPFLWDMIVIGLSVITGFVLGAIMSGIEKLKKQEKTQRL